MKLYLDEKCLAMFRLLMLRSMIFKNFVHYHDYQSLEFNTGFNLIIGGNSSGKSVIFEIIRRCLSTRLNATITSTYGESKVSFANCRFVNVSADLEILLSGIFKQPREESKQAIYVKFIIFQTSGEQYIFCANRYVCTESNILLEDTIMSSENIYVTAKKTPNIYNYLKDGVVPRDSAIVEKEIIVLCGECDFQDKKESECQRRLELLDNSFVATFPMRSIGPSQWTESDRVNASLRTENEIITNDRAEIIHFIFEKGKKGFDKHLFEETLWKLTRPKRYTLSLEEIKEYDGETNPKKLIRVNGKSLIRAPEGVVEAVQFALIFSCRDYYTICLEEPDRGMHSHMVERLSDIIYRSKNKVFILISHNISFVSRWTLQHTHICVPESLAAKKPLHRVISFSNLDTSIASNVQTLADTDDLKKILFSSKILCVEGKEDKILIDAIFDYLVEQIRDDEKDFIVGELQISREEIQYFSSHQKVALGSNTMEGPVRRCCEALGLKCTSLLDLDAFVRVNKEKKGIKIFLEGDESKSYKEAESFKDLATFDRDKNGFEKLAELKEKKGIFFWRIGRLEEVILQSLTKKQIDKHFNEKQDVRVRHLSKYEFASKDDKKQLKRHLLGFNRSEFSALVKDLIETPEILRFFNFMKRVFGKETLQERENVSGT